MRTKMIAKAKTATYELGKKELIYLFAKELGVSEDMVGINFKTVLKGDDQPGNAPHTEVTGIEVIVTDKIVGDKS